MAAEEEEISINELRFIPVDRTVCDSLLEVLGDQSVRVDRLNELVSSDPILLLEVVAAANGLKNIAGGKAVLEGKAALLALGLERIRKLVQELAETTPHFEDDKAHWLEVIKDKCRKNAAVSSLIAKAVRPESTFECFTIGLLAYLGDMIALSKLGNDFIGLLEQGLRRSKLRYQLGKDFNFSLEEETIDYLKKRTIPGAVPLSLDPESSKLFPNVQAMKEICLSSSEFVDAYVEDRLDRLAPGISIPPKSYRRMLALTDSRYEALYESIDTFFEKGEFSEQVVLVEPQGDTELLSSDGNESSDGKELVEVRDGETNVSELVEVEDESSESEFGAAFQSIEVKDVPEPGDVVSFEEEFARPIETVPRRKYVSKSDEAMPKFVSMFEDTQSTDELLERLLDMLVHQPQFECAALLIVDLDESKAMAVITRGRTLVDSESGIIEIEDALSPLLNVKSKMVSYSPRRKDNSPFGSSNYAIAPLEVDYKRPVILYADCGEGSILTFEGRRLFRKVVDMLNNILPKMKGAIPIEEEDTLSG